MKKLSLVSVLSSLFFAVNALAADITIYYAPSCPHCHHARDFISNTLIYEYPELKVTMVDVTKPQHREMFRTALNKCGYTSGGVPVLVIGEKCEQGYAEYMQDTLRNHIEVDLSDEQKQIAAENKKSMASDAEKFKSENAERKNSITEYDVGLTDASAGQKKNNNSGIIGLSILLVLLVVSLGYVLVRKDKKSN